MRRVVTLLCAAAVSATLLIHAPTARSAPDPDGAEAALEADADGPVRIRREGGVATFVGTPAGTEVDNPSVDRGTTVSAAARSHLRRYGALVGADRDGTVLKETRRNRSAAGTDVVRYQQEVDGLPVMGGEVVVTLAGDRDLGSLNANLSATERVLAATVTEKDARATAIARVARSLAGTPVAESRGRWLFDPEAVAWAGASGARGVWRFEVRLGDSVRRMVLVDDRTGAVLLDVDLIQHIDPVVCDSANVIVASPAPCTTGFARTSSAETSAVADVNQAFSNSVAVADFYDQIGGWDLTDMIGLTTSIGRRLSSSVRVCVSGSGCPYGNAYWNGEAMFYGQGYAAADDVVGHEMTHGVIERTSGLLYWDQSGAINESLADILGEIIDHRNVDAGDAVDPWKLGEDLPIGGLRDVADPTLHGDPDRMTSALWDVDVDHLDAGGVHTNSGVGNKAFHLISQGGTFNGQTITGIDAGDPGLAKSATLWLQVINTITSFTEYADLAVVLDQACSALVGTNGFSSADCAVVHQATVATEMGTEPPGDPVREADRTCPVGTFKRILFDSESGSNPAGKFIPGPGWGRMPGTTVNDFYDVNAYSGGTAWVAEDPATEEIRSLRAATSVALPAGQTSYLAFRHWHLFDFDRRTASPSYWDGGTVELERDGVAEAPVSLSSQTWDHGPTRTLQAPNAGLKAFSGSSRGWVGSRVLLDGYEGQSVRPVFTVRSDDIIGDVGWYLDDVEVYTCDHPMVSTAPPTITGSLPRVGRHLYVSGAQWAPGTPTVGYQWLRSGSPITGATGEVYTPVAADLGKRIGVRATGTLGDQVVPVVAFTGSDVRRGILKPPVSVYTRGRPLVGRTLSGVPGYWEPKGVTFRYRWLRDGKAIRGATSRLYTLKRADRGHRIRVRITGVKAGYTSVVKVSPSTVRVR